MMRKFANRKGIIIGVVIVVLLFFLMRSTAVMNRAELTRFEIIIRDALAPLYSGAMQVSRTIVNLNNSFSLYNELLDENAQLKEQIRRLSLQNNQLEEYRLENQRLRLLLGLKENETEQFELTAARVIGRNMGNWFDTIVVDKGSRDGVSVDMSVINHQGLVGRVTAVSNNTAEIMLLLDRESAVGAMVQRERTFGVVEAAPKGDYPLELVHLAHDAEIQIGDVIITSGLGEIFPKGLKIGYVADVEMALSGLVKQAKIVPYVDFTSLEEVMIVLSVKALPDAIELDPEVGEE